MSLFHFKRLVIIGVGLIGGSIGMAARRYGVARRVVGVDQDYNALRRALELGAVDEIQETIEAALDGADAIVLAMPPEAIKESFRVLASFFTRATTSGVFVTDVASIKSSIVSYAEQTLPRTIHFVGSHPMAGSEHSGIEAARVDLYDNAVCLLTPTLQTSLEGIALAERFWGSLRLQVVQLDLERHDQLLAAVSHLPHLVASSLMQSVLAIVGDAEEVGLVAGGGLRDTTRIAGSDSNLWTQICMANKPNVLLALDLYLKILNHWREALASDDVTQIEQLFRQAREARRISFNQPHQ